MFSFLVWDVLIVVINVLLLPYSLHHLAVTKFNIVLLSFDDKDGWNIYGGTLNL